MKMDFQQVLFKGEARATLNGQDGWAKDWNSIWTAKSYRFRRQQEVVGPMISVEIIGDIRDMQPILSVNGWEAH